MFSVRVFEVSKPVVGMAPTPPVAAAGFRVDASDVDAAKQKTRTRFAQSEVEVRSIAIVADAPNTLVAYVFSKTRGA